MSFTYIALYIQHVFDSLPLSYFAWRFTSQILGESKKFAYQTGVRVVVAYGGTPIGHQVNLIAPFSCTLLSVIILHTLRIH